MIQLSQHEGLAQIELNTPPCNELGAASLDQLELIVAQLKKDPPQVVLVRSLLPAGFCAGADLRELHRELTKRDLAQQKQDLDLFLSRIHKVFFDLDTLPCPTLAVVNGICFGGGFELALVCDLIIAESDARFAFPELRLGIVPGFGGIPRLKRDVGNAVVRDLLFSGRSLNAQRAHELGLVSQVVKVGYGAKAALALARQMQKYQAEVLMQAKAFIKPQLSEELVQEKALFLKMFFAYNTQQALGEFVERKDILPYLAK